MNCPDAIQPASGRTKRSRLLFRIGAVLAGLLAGLVLAMLLLTLRARLFPSTQWIYLYEPGHEETGHRYIYDATLGWRNIPNWTGTTFGKPLSINSHGLRDLEYSYEKPANRRRILVLGDSYTWGYGVGNKEIYTEVLENSLLQQKDWQVLNAGVSGWGTDQQYLFLRKEGFRYDPDIVIVSFFFGNDFREISSSQQYQLDKPVFINTALELNNSPVPKPRHEGANPVYYSTAPSDQLAEAIFRRMAADCKKKNARLVVFKFGAYVDPPTRKLFETTMPPRRREDLIEMARRSAAFNASMQRISGLQYLDMDAIFEKEGFTFAELGVIPSRDMHWNSFGHSKVAAGLYAFLAENDLLETNPLQERPAP